MAAFTLAFFEREADLERHLVAPELPVLHLATHLGHLEPPDVADGGGCPRDRILDGIGDAGARGSDKLDQLIDVLGHDWLSCAPGQSGESLADPEPSPRRGTTRGCAAHHPGASSSARETSTRVSGRNRRGESPTVRP